MPDVKATEGEFKSLVISWVNSFFEKGSYPFQVASADPSIRTEEGKRRFPDVQIWKNREAQDGFCGWELKTPDTLVDDPGLFNLACEKAQAMHADYFITWNMRETVIWRAPVKGKKVTQEYRQYAYPILDQIYNTEDLWDNSKQILLKERAKQILDDLVTLFREGHLHQTDTDATFFVRRLKEATDKLGPYLHKSLVKKVGEDTQFKKGLNDWAIKQSIQNFGTAEFYDTVSRQILYRTLGKILFYLTLRRFRSDIPKLDLTGIDPKKTSKELKEFFEIAKQIDYQAVFEEDFPDKVEFPPEISEPLSQLIFDLNRFNYSFMPQDVVGQVFEKLIPYEERHALGQYFTREELVDLINAFCVRSKDDIILDPTCGTGTFLVRAYDRKKIAGERDHKRLLSHLWGIDVAPFPAELATINLYRLNLDDYANFPRILTFDFFDVKPGQLFEFPPPKPTEDKSESIKEKLPLFDGAVGNFPYIRQELINKGIPGYKKKIQKVLFEDWKDDYRALFDNGNVKISGQADIYAFLFFHAARFLKEEGGRMGFVTSNAWLDVAYGYELQKFFLKNFKIIAILESRCEPWFEDPAVNTIVTILERCKNKKERENHLVKFVKVKKKLKELIPWDMRLKAMDRWAGLDRIALSIESKGGEYIKIENNKVENTLKGIATYEDDNFRIRVVKQGELLEKIEETKKTMKWGQFLRAPEIFFEILKICKDKLVPLNEIADVTRGYTTGINEFFYLTKEKIEHWGIEKEFLRPIVTSPKEIEGILIKPKSLEFKILACHKSKKDLLKERKYKVLKYIKWGEKQVTIERGRYKKGGIPFPEVPSVQGRPFWYDVGQRTPGEFVVNRFINERFFFPVNKSKVFLGDVVFEGRVKNKKESTFYWAVLNSSLSFLFVELTGRFILGEGLLTFYGPDINQLYVVDYDCVTPAKRKAIVKAFHKLLTRSVKPVFEEVKMKDRQKLDKLVLQILGLDPKKYLKPIYEGICELVKERIQLAKMRKNTKNAVYKKDVEKLKESVLEEILPEGAKNFPEEFIDSAYLKDSQEISITGKPLKLGHFFMGLQEVVSEDGYKYEAKSLEEAKFILYSQKPDTYIVKIPKNKIALSQAVAKYEKYIRELKDRLFKTFFERVLDHKQAEHLTNAVFEDLGLNRIAES